MGSATAPVLERDLSQRASATVSSCGRYRFVLERTTVEGGRTVCWIMLNPSTADAERDDATIRDIMRRTAAWGYDSLRVVNLYPFRATDPRECARWAATARSERDCDWAARDALGANAFIIERESREADLVMCAWGAAPWAISWAEFIIEDHLQSGIAPAPDLYCLGTTRDGWPKHPLARGRERIPREQEPIPWRRP